MELEIRMIANSHARSLYAGRTDRIRFKRYTKPTLFELPIADMKRREFLATSSFGLLSVGSGCTALGLDTGVPDGMTVETRHWGSVVLEDGLAAELESGWDEPIIVETLLTRQETALERLEQESPATEFAVETDFGQSYLAVIEYLGMSSSQWLELRSLERQESGIHVVAEVESPDSGTFDDLSPHSLVIRITEEDAERPANISAEVVSCGYIRCTDHL